MIPPDLRVVAVRRDSLLSCPRTQADDVEQLAGNENLSDRFDDDRQEDQTGSELDQDGENIPQTEHRSFSSPRTMTTANCRLHTRQTRFWADLRPVLTFRPVRTTGTGGSEMRLTAGMATVSWAVLCGAARTTTFGV